MTWLLVVGVIAVSVIGGYCADWNDGYRTGYMDGSMDVEPVVYRKEKGNGKH